MCLAFIPRQNSYIVTNAAREATVNPINAPILRIPETNKTTSKMSDPIAGIHNALPKVFQVECPQADKGAIPINNNKPANRGPVVLL